jgi:hypothetical protein
MMLKRNGQGTKGCSFDGCSCHNTKDQRRKGKRPVKRAEERAWKREAGL